MVDTQTILFGCDPTEHIVAVEPLQDKVELFIRENDGIRTEIRPFSPWLLTAERHNLAGADWTELEGEGYRFLARFSNWSAHRAARFKLKDEHVSHFAIPSAVKQYLMMSGQTHFKGMAYSDVLRLQLDIETLGFTPDQPENLIFLIAVSDNHGYERLIEGSEKEMLQELVELIRQIDPDVIEGHNIFGFDLPYIAKRAEMHGIRLTFGRDGSEMSAGTEKSAAIGGISRPMTPFYIYGRHIVDTLLAVQRYDITRGVLSSHSLKECAKVFGLASADRVYIEHDQIASMWKTDPDCVRKYAMQDVYETRALSNLIGPPEFYLTQMVPDSYASIVITGTGEKINSIMVREYLRRGHAIPKPQIAVKEVPGGFTDIKATGLIERVVKCDVESLYPSLMLTHKIKPSSDTLDVFLPALEELTKRRFDAKAKAKSATGSEQAYWDGLQTSFKILINSFYGYLGAVFNFNDYTAAETVTTTGQAIVKRIADELERTGSRIIEIDTDGVYFQPPQNVDGLDAEIAYIEQIGRILPEGIRLAHDGRYKAMLSLKVKNYVLVGYDGKKTFKGASVRSRADELFGREFISSAVDLLLAGEKQKVSELYKQIAADIETHRMPVEKFARRERITEKTFTSDAKKRLAEAAKDAKVGEYVNVYERADGTIGLITDYKGDEDTKYLLDKLYKFACRLREAFGDEFDLLFPRPSAKTAAEAAGQQTLSLFD